MTLLKLTTLNIYRLPLSYDCIFSNFSYIMHYSRMRNYFVILHRQLMFVPKIGLMQDEHSFAYRLADVIVLLNPPKYTPQK